MRYNNRKIENLNGKQKWKKNGHAATRYHNPRSTITTITTTTNNQSHHNCKLIPSIRTHTNESFILSYLTYILCCSFSYCCIKKWKSKNLINFFVHTLFYIFFSSVKFFLFFIQKSSLSLFCYYSMIIDLYLFIIL